MIGRLWGVLPHHAGGNAGGRSEPEDILRHRPSQPLSETRYGESSRFVFELNENSRFPSSSEIPSIPMESWVQ